MGIGMGISVLDQEVLHPDPYPHPHPDPFAIPILSSPIPAFTSAAP